MHQYGDKSMALAGSNRRILLPLARLWQHLLYQSSDFVPPSNPFSSESGGDRNIKRPAKKSMKHPPQSSPSRAAAAPGEFTIESGSIPSVSVFWDLDNKPPNGIRPYDAAVRLKEIAGRFGSVVDMVAYANRHAFSYLPPRVKMERRDRKVLHTLEVKGLVVPEEPYVCEYCGRKCKTNVELTKHFKQLHERERNKRMNRLDSLKGKNRKMYKETIQESEEKYKAAARDIIIPKVGYGLAGELKRAGVWVKTVSDKPDAADQALKQHMMQAILRGIQCICLVSDDSDFSEILKRAHNGKLCTIVVGDTPVLQKDADVWFSWDDVASGAALKKAKQAAGHWYGGQDFVEHDRDNREGESESSGEESTEPWDGPVTKPLKHKFEAGWPDWWLEEAEYSKI